MIIIDSGPMIALCSEADHYHEHCVRKPQSLPSGPMTTPWPCFTEAMHLLYRKGGFPAQSQLWKLLFDKQIVIAELSDELKRRAAELMEKYRDLPMDLADASVVALVEVSPTPKVFTIDSDYHIYRLRDGSPVPLA